MNSDAKVGIIVVLAICSGLGFVLLAAPNIKDNDVNVKEDSLFANLFNKPKEQTKSFLDEDLSVEVLKSSGVSNNSNDKPQEITKVESNSNVAKNDKKLNNKLPEEHTSNLQEENKDKNDAKIDSDLFGLENSNNKPLDNDFLHADTKKVVETKIDTNKPLDKPLEPKVLEDITHIVKAGDTLSIIAKKYYQDSSKHQLLSDANNGIKSPNLKIGMKIFVPGTESQKKYTVITKPTEKISITEGSKPVIYKVKEGDTISSIAKKFFGENYSMSDVKAVNPGKDLSRLKIGESINMPAQSKKK